MHPHRTLAITALVLGAIALSGCTTASSVTGVAVRPAVSGEGHPTVAVIGDSIESGSGLRPAEAWPAVVAVDRRWELENYSVPGAGFAARHDKQDFGAQVDQTIGLRADMVLVCASDNDLGQPYRDQAGPVQDDGEHPTPGGQQKIAAAVLERLDDRA